MRLARRAAAPALAGRSARACQYPSAGRAHAERRSFARPGPCASGRRDRDRRQSAPPIPGGAAGEGADLLFRRYPGRRGGRIRCLHPRAARHAPRLTACRCCAAASWRRTALPRSSSSRRQMPPGRCRAIAASPMRDELPAGSRLVEGRMVEARLSGPAAGLVRETHRRRAGPEGRRHRHGQRAGPQYHRDGCQPARGRLAEPRHQFRHGVLARRRSAARRNTAHRHPHLSPAASTPEEEVALLKAVANAFPAVTAVRVRDALDAVGQIGHQSGRWRSGEQRAHPGGGRAGAGRSARGRASAPGL